MITRRRICAKNEELTSPSKLGNMSLNIFVTISNNTIIPIMNTNIVMSIIKILIIPIILIIMKNLPQRWWGPCKLCGYKICSPCPDHWKTRILHVTEYKERMNECLVIVKNCKTIQVKMGWTLIRFYSSEKGGGWLNFNSFLWSLDGSLTLWSLL